MAPDPRRLELQSLLQEVVGSSNKVYFQPPAGMTMAYPCIVYALDNAKTEFADNHPYSRTKRYQVTVIDKDPDTLFPDDIAQIPLTNFQRSFTKDNLHHYIFTLYF